jgi:hypothetical protein
MTDKEKAAVDFWNLVADSSIAEITCAAHAAWTIGGTLAFSVFLAKFREIETISFRSADKTITFVARLANAFIIASLRR